MAEQIPDPAFVLLVGASGSGKSHWARSRYRTAEIVAADDLRAVVGSGEADLDASAEAFDLLERIVEGRLRRGLTVVVDTLGTDAGRRRRWLGQARAAGLPTVAVLVATPARLCRERNRRRDRPVPAAVLTAQLARMRTVEEELAGEGWTVLVVDGSGPGSVPDAGAEAARDADPVPGSATPPVVARRPGRPEVILQVSRFPQDVDLAEWLTGLARAADALGFSGIALMDHLIQIPQVGRAWEPIPEPWVTLGLLAGLDTRLRLGTLVSPITFRAPGVTAKAAATLDVLTGGRAFLGLGAGWWEREHLGYHLAFPPAAERLDALEQGVGLIRALWASGTKPYRGSGVTVPETICYPRPVGRIPVIIGGSGERRTLQIAARWADGCNLPSDPSRLPHRIEVLRRHCAEAGRDPAEVAITVLDVPIVGADREDTARRVERLRGRSPASAFGARHHAGTVDDHLRRYRELAEADVSTVFCALPDLHGPEDLVRLAPLVAGLA